MDTVHETNNDVGTLRQSPNSGEHRFDNARLSCVGGETPAVDSRDTVEEVRSTNGENMLIGVCALLLSAVFHTAGAYRSARDDRDRALPMVWGRYVVKSSQVVQRLHTVGWIESIVGALWISGSLWDSRPGLSIAIVVTVLVAVNGLPSLLVTVLHGRKVRS